MGWAKLDDRWHQDPRLWKAGLEATGLACRGITYAVANKTNGFLDESVVQMLAGVRNWRKIANALVLTETWESDEGRGGWWIMDPFVTRQTLKEPKNGGNG